MLYLSNLKVDDQIPSELDRAWKGYRSSILNELDELDELDEEDELD